MRGQIRGFEPVGRLVGHIIAATNGRTSVLDLLSPCRSRQVGSTRHEVVPTAFAVSYMRARIYAPPVGVNKDGGIRIPIGGQVRTAHLVVSLLRSFPVRIATLKGHFSDLRADEDDAPLNSVKPIGAPKHPERDENGIDLYKMAMVALVTASVVINAVIVGV